ncbi:MAG: 3-deoxy-7-phosphoheptulonate synthase [Planctomycetota bacterium]
MLILMKSGSTIEECSNVEALVRRQGFEPLPVPGENRIAICVTGNTGPVDPGPFSDLPGVLDCIAVTKPYKLVSREVHPEDTVVRVGNVAIGGRHEPALIAGPCSVETEARTLAIAQAAQRAGARMFRAGAFKPRSSPYAFQGLGNEALVTLARVREETGLPIVSEVLDAEAVSRMEEVVDLLQVGTRNMQNFALLRRLAKSTRPVLLKRGLSASFEEWMMAAEYLLMGGNPNVILCERGVRTFVRHSRNTLDLNVVPLVRERSHLPVIVDPSHGCGARDRVRAMARAALAAGAHGLLIEAHTDPASSYTDAAQTIDIRTLSGVTEDAQILGRLERLEPVESATVR